MTDCPGQGRFDKFTKVPQIMRGLILGLLTLVLLIVIGGGLYLLFANPTPTVKTVETAIPNDRFPN
jgi:hypothetical protein